MVNAAHLPAASQTCIYFRAPQNAAGGGLLNAITKNILTTQPENIFQLVNRPPFLAVKQGHIPLKDVFDAWLQEQLNHAYFFAMKQIGKHLYIGQEIPTESL